MSWSILRLRTYAFRCIAAGALASVMAAITLPACAPQRPGLREQPPDPGRQWRAFLEKSAAGSQRPGGFRIKASLNLDTPEGSHRIVFRLWGNYELPMRVDLTTGFGTPFAMWRVDSERFLAYYPGQQRAYVGSSSRRTSAAFGLRTPFELPELAWLLTARFDKVLSEDFQSAREGAQGRWIYRLGESRAGRKAVLDGRGRMVALSGSRPYSWSIEFSRYAASAVRPLPRKVVLSRNGTENAVIRIKDALLGRQPWKESSLQLRLPEDTMYLPLE
jgi:hypothetical protein